MNLLEQSDRAWQAIDYLRRKIEGHDEVFAAALLRTALDATRREKG